eukprot:CAMPEP_0185744612 /NCGR_PEP_ID=MMETSP1174-20130828/2770_1 /TAXON_ID=35687 /ORGANISM="Dictyocha speculum, Strain CCMP1381" /LENGTH=147 /DNA_ID=CAMNT_0028418115 /DNA_START=94 /DNA_END=534 /DNA_ORIENTATION=-
MTQYTAVDVAVQSLVERKNGEEHKMDWNRTCVFAAHGFLWGGVGQWFIFNRVFPHIFTATTRRVSKGPQWTAVAKCVFADNFVHIPFFYMPIFYFIREFATGEGTVVDCASRSNALWRENVLVDTARQACIFVPVQTWNFAMNPPHW